MTLKELFRGLVLMIAVFYVLFLIIADPLFNNILPIINILFNIGVKGIIVFAFVIPVAIICAALVIYPSPHSAKNTEEEPKNEIL